MRVALEIYLWLGLVFGFLTLIFGLMREKTKEQHALMSVLKWLLGALAVTFAWPVALFWFMEGELNRNRAIRKKMSQQIESTSDKSILP